MKIEEFDFELTRENLEKKTRKELSEIYNVLAVKAGKEQLGLAASHNLAVQRVVDMIDKNFSSAGEGSKKPKKVKVAGDKTRGPAKLSRRRFAYGPDAKIKINVDDNPFKQNSTRHARFALLKNGMAVEKYVALENEHTQFGGRWATNLLKILLKMDAITITE